MLVADTAIQSWSMSKYGRAPTFYLGINLKDPPSEDNCPVIALYPLPESGGKEIYPWTHAVGVEWVVSNENTREIMGITECLGLIESDELGQLILDVISADSEYVSNQVDYSISPVEKWPMYQGEMSIVARPAPAGGTYFLGIESAQIYPITAEAMHAITYGDPVELHQVDRFEWEFETLEGLSEADAGTIDARAEVNKMTFSMTLGVFDAAVLPYLMGGAALNAGSRLPGFKLEVVGTVPGGAAASVIVDKAKVLRVGSGMSRAGYSTLAVTGIGIGRLHDRRLMEITGI